MKKENNIGNRIKKLRENLGFTQKQLANKLGLKSEATIANYESGYSIPKDKIKIKICKLFNCSLDYLMCETNSKSFTQLDEATLLFINEIKELNKENQKIAKNIIEGLLAKQYNERKKEI